MKLGSKSIGGLSLSLALGLGLTLVSAMPVVAAPGAWFQYGDRFDDIRNIVDRTQSDLHRASRLENAKGDQRSRYDNAQKHLSTFDRHLVKGHFDKGELDPAISDLQHILDKNTLQAADRDALTRDIQDLRAVRDRRY